MPKERSKMTVADVKEMLNATTRGSHGSSEAKEPSPQKEAPPPEEETPDGQSGSTGVRASVPGSVGLPKPREPKKE